jgi:thermitase
MKKFIFLSFALVVSSAFAQEANYLTNKLMVKVKPGMKISKNGLITSSRNLFGNVYVVETKSLYQLEDTLKNDSAVEYFERSFVAPKRKLADKGVVPAINKSLENMSFNDPMASRVWSFNDASMNGVSVLKAYENATTHAKETVIVAVVDTGVDYNHEDLKDVMWINEKEVADNGIDDDNNGYIDDIHGINTLSRDSNGKPSGEIMDEHSHGTHVSGTIAAKQNNNKGIAGIASNVKIMGIRTVPNDGDETDVDVVESYIYAAKNGARLINCSFGKQVNEGGKIVQEAIDYVGKEYDVLVVAAAGNESSNNDVNPKWPASYPNENLLVIAATTSAGGLAYFSNYGLKSVDVAAPGNNILSSVPGNKYASYSGTSMATPTTVGVLAEILSHYPELTALELKAHIMNTVTKVTGFTNKMISGGRIDLDRALNVNPPKTR